MVEALPPVVFSMGFNGYQWKYAKNIRTHRAYCRKHGYDYVMLEKPGFTELRRSSAWLKICAIVGLLQAGRPWVLYLDTDVEIKDDAPAFTVLDEQGGDFFIANGFSGRANSGVMLIKNTPEITEIFSRMYLNAKNRVPEPDYVSGWGENGHVIHYTKNHPGTRVISNMWNNNIDPAAPDYFRHYSAGPMRKHYQMSVGAKVVNRVAKAYEKMFYEGRDEDLNAFHENMEKFANIVYSNYPKFFPGSFDPATGGLTIRR